MIKRVPNPFSASFSNATVVPPAEYTTIYLAGQVGHPPEGPVKVTAGTFEEEAGLCFANIRLALEKAGATMRDVVRITAYLTNLSDYPAYDRVRKETFPDSPPASSTVQVAGLLVNAHLEIDTVAVIKTKQPVSIEESERTTIMPVQSVEQAYVGKTRKSAELMARAARSLPGGVTRNFGWHRPYPVVMERGKGAFLWDVDGNRYVDLVYNGLSLIHGHAYPPVADALASRLPEGWAWLGTSRPQIEFAEMLCNRIKIFKRVLFTNSGTESGMLAVKLARGFTGRPLILKATAGYHGTYSDLEAGLHGQGELPGHTLLADFNDLASFERVLAEHGPKIAAVLLEPVMYTGVVTPPRGSFLRGVQDAAHRAGALFVLDDCLMFRLAVGGSAEKFGLQPDITFLGKFIGGGIPVGAVGSRQEIIDLADPGRVSGLYHGGSFNGNVLGAVAGRLTVGELTERRIAKMDELAGRLKGALESRAQKLGLPLTVFREGSVMGAYFTRDSLKPGTEIPNQDLSLSFHLACLVNGLHTGPYGLISMSTAIDDTIMAEVISAAEDALDRVAAGSLPRFDSVEEPVLRRR